MSARKALILLVVAGVVLLAALVTLIAAASSGGGSARIEPVPRAASTEQQAQNLSAWLTEYSR